MYVKSCKKGENCVKPDVLTQMMSPESVTGGYLPQVFFKKMQGCGEKKTLSY